MILISASDNKGVGLRSANLFRCNAGPRDEARSCTGNSPKRFFLSGPRVRATQASEGSPSGIMCVSAPRNTPVSGDSGAMGFSVQG